METSQIAAKSIFFTYKIIGALFGVITALNFLVIFPFNLWRHFFVFAAIYAIYAGLSGVLAYGFWKMKKWLVPLLGGAALIMMILDIINVFRGVQKIDQALVGLAIIFALFLFTYFSRNFLGGEYKNLKALGWFLSFLILSQAAIFFFN